MNELEHKKQLLHDISKELIKLTNLLLSHPEIQDNPYYEELKNNSKLLEDAITK